ncbi:hypothetical protein, partial [Sulfobacillus harzensis]|uniref:hypothetical protein n=1 Tax=Sulfobacillus harzensis TaxID=2729629 RepID=UPI001A9B6488
FVLKKSPRRILENRIKAGIPSPFVEFIQYRHHPNSKGGIPTSNYSRREARVPASGIQCNNMTTSN